jgi:hypothetical protein
MSYEQKAREIVENCNHKVFPPLYSPQEECLVEDIAAALRAQNAAMAEALRGLEDANEAFCASRSQSLYNQMIFEGLEDVLENLDIARRAARAALLLSQEGNLAAAREERS